MPFGLGAESIIGAPSASMLCSLLLLAAVSSTSGFGVSHSHRGWLRPALPPRAYRPLLASGGASIPSGDRVAKPGGGGGTALMEDSDFSVNTILKQLESIQQGTPKNIVILGTRHCSFLHQQIIELLSCVRARPRQAPAHRPRAAR
jgi:hypothetical protein